MKKDIGQAAEAYWCKLGSGDIPWRMTCTLEDLTFIATSVNGVFIPYLLHVSTSKYMLWIQNASLY